MPMYTVLCQVCAKTSTAKLTFSEYDETKAGTFQPSCGECGGWAAIQFDPGNVNFVLKDGESGGWISKAGKENSYRARHRAVMAKRERDHVFKSRLQPNYAGTVTENWKEASQAAYESTYDRVKQEHGAQTAQQAAQESARTYDPLINRGVSG